jgi:hypothetical protein
MLLNKPRRFGGVIVAVWACALLAQVAPVGAGLTVTSYRTVAQTNGFSPVGSGQYFAEQRLTNVSPAHAAVSGDWMGPNADGTPNTWHFVGASQATSTTAFDDNSLTVTAAGSFGYEINTTPEFIDPRSASVFSPGGAANYRGFFELDTTATYTASVRLNQYSGISLGNFDTGFIFNEFNFGTVPVLFQVSGTIPAGRYQILGTAGFGVPNLPNGINHDEAAGSFENMVFTVQVPEPTHLGTLFAIVVGIVGPRGRRSAQ